MEAKLNGVAIDYEDGGCGPAVLVLHDYPSSGDLRGHFLPLVQAGYRVILTDLGGFDDGQTGHALAALGLLNYLGIGRAAILGISQGGPVLLELMEKHPGRVAAGSLIVSDATALALRQRVGEVACNARGGDPAEGFQSSCLAAASVKGALDRAPAELRSLPAWIERVRSRTGGRKDLHALLEAIDLPPLMVESPSAEPAPVPGTVGRRRFGTLNGHLSRLLDALVPRDEDADEEVALDEG